MADDSQYTLQFKNELQQEAILLQSIKDKLVDQLQRLKVEELALVGSSNSSSFSQTANSTGTYFNNSAIQGSTNINKTDDVNETINSMPLSGDLSESLVSNSLIFANQPEADQEEEEDDDDEEDET